MSLFKKRAHRISYALNGALFAFSGFTSILDEQFLFGPVQVIAAVFNFLMLKKRNRARQVLNIETGVFVLNFVVAVITTLNYYNAGTKYLHYAWALISTIFLILLVLNLTKRVKGSHK